LNIRNPSFPWSSSNSSTYWLPGSLLIHPHHVT
jgi:hypothetical protein